ncbi:hypothetical protein D3C78_1959580 [compost metagenome]
MHDNTGRMTQTKLTQLVQRNDLPVRRLRVDGKQTACVTTTWFSKAMGADELQDLIGPDNQPAHTQFAH